MYFKKRERVRLYHKFIFLVRFENLVMIFGVHYVMLYSLIFWCQISIWWKVNFVEKSILASGIFIYFFPKKKEKKKEGSHYYHKTLKPKP
jgi:hypothetical protein